MGRRTARFPAADAAAACRQDDRRAAQGCRRDDRRPAQGREGSLRAPSAQSGAHGPAAKGGRVPAVSELARSAHQRIRHARRLEGVDATLRVVCPRAPWAQSRHLRGHDRRARRRLRLLNPFVLRSVAPPLNAVAGRKVKGVRRMGKRIVFELEGALFLVLHLMIAGRLRWLAKDKKPPGRISLAALEFEDGTLIFTEAGTKRRASIHLVEGEAALAAMDPGGLEVLEAGPEEFAARLKADRHTLKRALTDPRLFSGIGNAYSDEILHRAKLSPFAQTSSLSDEDVKRLYDATRATLAEWTERLRREAGADFPEKVTA